MPSPVQLCDLVLSPKNAVLRPLTAKPCGVWSIIPFIPLWTPGDSSVTFSEVESRFQEEVSC